ncbi:hypothetical protein Ndes2437B_g03200 [Nannochloris sp. 'desiccata']
MTLSPAFVRRICTTASLSRAVRPIPLKLISVAKGTSSKDGTAFGNEWADKVRRYTQIEELQIKPNPMNTKDPKIAKQQEGERVLKSVRAGERLIVLDERGRDLKSENFAEILAQASDEGWPAVVFAIGGPYGHSPEPQFLIIRAQVSNKQCPRLMRVMIQLRPLPLGSDYQQAASPSSGLSQEFPWTASKKHLYSMMLPEPLKNKHMHILKAPVDIPGLSVGAMVIPQGMSYAKLAGLPQEYGLYGAFVPCIVYALLGSSRQLAVGPVAVTSVLLGNGLESLFQSGGSNPCIPPTGAVPPPPPPIDDGTAPITCMDYQKAAVQVAFLAGVMYTGVGLLGLGWLTYFLSHATISGFMSGAAILIALSQVKYILGISTPRADKLVPQLEYIFGNLSGFNWREFCMGMSFILILLVFRTASRRVKRLAFLRSLGPLTVCILSIALMNIFDWYEIPPGSTKPLISPIGSIPSGMPSVTVGWWFPLYDTGKQLLLAVVICLIDMCESMSIAKALASKNKYRLNATQELRGLGVANLAGAVFNCYTTTGSFSRTAVNDSVGAKSLISSFVTGLLVMFTLLFLTPVMKNMSQNVQGAIIITGVLGLFQWEDFLEFWRVAKFDWLVWIATFLCTLFLGVEVGILVGVALSLVLVIYKTAFPRISAIGRLPGTNIYRNIKMYPDAENPPGMLCLRIDASIFFANVEGIRDYLTDKLQTGKDEHERAGDPVHFVIIDLSPSPDIDIAGVHLLHEIISELKSDGIRLILANPSKNVLLMLRRAKVLKELGPNGVQVSVGEAVRWATDHLSDGPITPSYIARV